MWSLWVLAIAGFIRYTTAILVPIEDIYGSKRYSINYLPFERWEQLIINNSTTLSSGTVMELGDYISCYVPNVDADLDSSVAQYNETELNEMLENGVKIITTVFNGCITYLGGFWNYELCSNTGLSQFDGDPKTSTSNYQLGRIKKSVEDREFQLLYDDFGYYISELVGSGDICDLTGHPRVVEIQYICRPAAGPASIQWVREIKTCHYEIQVAIPELCSLEILSKSEDKIVSRSILCVNKEDSNSGVVDIISSYKPTFLGNEVYLLEPYDKISSHNRTALMFTGNMSSHGSLLEQKLDIKLANAISRMVFQHLLLLPDGLPYNVDDKFAWMSEVLDSKGNFVTMVQFNLSSTLADIDINSSIEFKGPGNFVFFERNVNRNLVNVQPDPIAEEEAAAMDRILEADLQEVTKQILKGLLSPDQILEALGELDLIEHEQGNLAQEESS